MARRKRAYLPMTSGPPWRISAIIASKGELPAGDALDAILDAARANAVPCIAQAENPEPAAAPAAIV
jgi:hypothetical protein